MKSGVIENEQEKLERTNYVLLMEPNITRHSWKKDIPSSNFILIASAKRFENSWAKKSALSTSVYTTLPSSSVCLEKQLIRYSTP